ncbi:hypothetical protein FANTH_3770 [Fusarium anthophilum]|uniref:Chromo domain-containing protein n=1 Tax=Fusarium anthophilum TaxID=48485 RepID=A0A8H5E8W8_9HYPO|nr:hypothetical protein FANTH_3770 [Fusarium anthophilum]
MAPASTLTTRPRRGRDEKPAINYAEEENSDSEPDSQVYEVENIKGDRTEEDGTVSLLVKWKGFEEEDWVPKKNFEKVGKDILDDYDKRKAKRRKPIAESDAISRTKRPSDNTSSGRSKRQKVEKGKTRDETATSLTTEKKSLFKHYENHLIAPLEGELMLENTMETLSSLSTAEKPTAACKSCDDEIGRIINLGRSDDGLLTFSITWENGEETKGEGATVLDCNSTSLQALSLKKKERRNGSRKVKWHRTV